MTPNQQRALGEAPQRERAKLRATFRAQRAEVNKPAVPVRQNRPPRSSRKKKAGKSAVQKMKGANTSFTYDGFSPSPMPLAFSIGRATKLQGLSRNDIATLATSAAHTHSVAIFNGHPGHYVGECIDYRGLPASGGSLPTIVRHWNMDAAGFSASTITNGSAPDTAMCAKFSVRIRNISKAVDVAGVVRVLNMSTGCVIDTSDSNNIKRLIDYVDGHPRTTTFGAAELRSSRQFDTHPIDQSKYHEFTSAKPDNGDNQTTWEKHLENPAMSTIVMVFPVIPLNHYEITVNAHYYGRFLATGPLANMASHPPTVPLNVLNKVRDQAEEIGSQGKAAFGRMARAAEKPFGEAAGAAAGAAAFG